MALQGKITANRVIQSGGIKSKTIVARQMSLNELPKLASLPDVDISARQDGSVMIWDDASSKFKIMGVVEETGLKIVGGSF